MTTHRRYGNFTLTLRRKIILLVSGCFASVGAWVGPLVESGDAFVLQQRQYAFGEPVRLLQVRVAGEDELVEADRVVLVDQVRHLFVAADEGGARSPANKPDARPQIGVDLQ